MVGRNQHHDRHGQLAGALLVLHIAVAREQHIKLTRRSGQQFAVDQAAPPMRCTVRTKWPGSAKLKLSRYRLVKQNAHALRPAWPLTTHPAPTRARQTETHPKTPPAFHPFRCIQTKSAPARACPHTGVPPKMWGLIVMKVVSSMR
jgi:hypothetical protein